MQGFRATADIFQEMYYLAITFIFIGLGCLLYLFVVRSFQGVQASSSSEQGSPDPERRDERASELQQYGFQEAVSEPLPHAASRDPRHAGYSPARASEQPWMGAPPIHEPAGSPAWSRSQSHSRTVSSSPSRNSRFEGILFLDESGQAVSAAEHWQQVSPDLFSKLKRMGPCQLQYSDRMFLIHSESIRLQYRVDDLTRILFLDSGFAFIPERGGPSPLILTREVDRFKNFLRDNSL
ncbi:MAG: hypothetical protein RH862_09900 [Leptospiraceae bacterium]